MNNNIRKMVATMVDWYADRVDGPLFLDITHIPESDLNNLASAILASDPMLASEANGEDNEEWERSMMPSLIRTMQKQKNGYSMEEFHDIWTAGIRQYLKPQMEKMIDERLKELNEDTGCHIRLVWNRGNEKVVELYS